MATITSPRLECSYDDAWLVDDRDETWLCIRELSKLLEFPKARWYWLEASDKQWEDGSGIRVVVKRECCWRRGNRGDWNYFPQASSVALRALGVLNDPKIIYFRLLYEE